MKQISFALVGFGNVGRGLIKLLASKEKWLAANNLNIAIVFLSTKRLGFRKSPKPISCNHFYEATRNEEGEALQKKLKNLFPLVLNEEEALSSNEINTVIELTPTSLTTQNASFQIIKQALSSKKNVITANKGPVALHFKELQQIATKNEVNLGFESTVLSGTPVFSLLKNSLKALTITGVRAILNGTCNFILSKMELGMPYQKALALATKLGYAETNPSADVEGTDSLAKLLILAEVVFGETLSINSTKCKGINTLTKVNFDNAKKEGKRIKLVAKVIITNNTIEASVSPTLISKEDPLYAVNGVNNAIALELQGLENVKIEGPGAGSLPTAVGIFSDLLQQNSLTIPMKQEIL